MYLHNTPRGYILLVMKKTYKQRTTHRSKIIEGQFKALIEAIENDKYCIDILTQSLAIQQSLRSLNKLILENHMNTHVKQGMSEGDEETKQVIIDEMVKLYHLTNSKG